MSPAPPSVLRMAAPLVVSFWMRALFSFVDTIYASKLGPGSDAAVAAIGLSFPFEFLMIAVWVGLSTGLTSNLSRAMGAGADARVEQHLRLSTRLVWGCVPVFAALGASLWFLAPLIAKDPEVARAFAIYGTVLIGGSAFSMFWSVIPDSIVKAHGDTKATMWAGIWSNVVNVVLNTIFTFVFGWGIFGIALSTVIGRFAGLAYALRKAEAHEAVRRARAGPRDPSLDPQPYRATFSLAIPSALAYTLMAAESAIVNGFLLRLDTAREAVAAYAIFYRAYQFAVMPVVATAVAMLPFAARRFGERDVAGVRRGLREAHLAGLAYTAALVPLLWFGAAPIAAFLAESPVTRDYAGFTLRLVPLGVLASLSFFLVRPVFEGLGRGRPGLVMALVRYVGLTAPFAWAGSTVARAWGVEGMYGLVLGLMAATALSSLAFLGWIRSSLQREERLADLAETPGPPLS
jgi:putative MATE family efflux protein